MPPIPYVLFYLEYLKEKPVKITKRGDINELTKIVGSKWHLLDKETKQVNMS